MGKSTPPDPGGRRPQTETRTAQGERQQPVPREPFERDESVDSQKRQEPSARRVGELAHRDAERGVADTSKARETDATYHRLREDAPPAAPPGGPLPRSRG